MMMIMTKFVYFAMFLFLLVGLDLILGAKLTNKIGNLMNKKVNIDNFALQFLAGMRKSGDKEIDVDNVLLRSKMRTLVGGILLVSSGFMFYSMCLMK